MTVEPFTKGGGLVIFVSVVGRHQTSSEGRVCGFRGRATRFAPQLGNFVATPLDGSACRAHTELYGTSQRGDSRGRELGRSAAGRHLLPKQWPRHSGSGQTPAPIFEERPSTRWKTIHNRYQPACFWPPGSLIAVAFWPSNAALYAAASGATSGSKGEAELIRLVREWVTYDWWRVAMMGAGFVSAVRAISVPIPTATA